MWAVSDAEWMVGVHAPRHGGFCLTQLANALPSGEHDFNLGHLEIRGFQCLEEALRVYYAGATRHQLWASSASLVVITEALVRHRRRLEALPRREALLFAVPRSSPELC